MGGSWTNGNNTLDESSLWYSNNGTTTSKLGEIVKVDGSNYDIQINDGKIEVGTIGEIDGQSTTNFSISSVGDIEINADNNDNENGKIIFKESGSEKMRITHEGKLGIGASTISAKLHVAGDAKIEGSLTMGDGSTNYKILNLADPTDDQQAATKSYVDDVEASLTTYVDNQVSNYTAGNDIDISNANSISLENDINPSTIQTTTIKAKNSAGIKIQDDQTPQGNTAILSKTEVRLV